MATFQSIKELTRILQQGSKLLADMFLKRKSVAIRYDDALDTLGGDERLLERLIHFDVIMRSGDQLELGVAYQQFFEEVLEVNEDINIGAIRSLIGKLRLNINTYLAADSDSRKSQLLRDIRYTFKSIESITRRNVADLRRNVDATYKQEPNFKIKELRLKDFDDKSIQVRELIRQTEKLMEEQGVFFATAANTVGMRETIDELRSSLRDSAHSLIDINAQIIDYLNRIEYQSKIVKKVRQLKYLSDMFMAEESSNIREVLAHTNDVWMEAQPRYSTRVSLDFLYNDDAALPILDDIHKRLQRKTHYKSRLAPPIDQDYLEQHSQQVRAFDHQEIFNAFSAQGRDLFNFVWTHRFDTETTSEERLVLFLQLASQYDEELYYTGETATIENYEYPIILHQ
ncbi:MAG: hypothetical protein ACOYJG_01390 [Prevotella sp.]|jgi:hypothetical protein